MEDDSILVIIRKCRCNQVHCKECNRYRLAVCKQRLQQFNWRYSRIITTTVSREYGTPEEIYNISRLRMRTFPRDIKRNLYRNYKRYISILEWQTGGYAHYHIIIEMLKAKMIGKNNIQNLWGIGNCWEDYFRTYQDWINVTGYFDKHSYFDMSHEKEHQLTPPDFILDGYKDIKKFTYSRNDDWLFQRQVGKSNGSQKDRKIKKKKVGERIDSCGNSIVIDILKKGNLIKNLVFNIPYESLKKVETLKYKERVGLIGKIKIKHLTKLLEDNRINKISEQEGNEIIERVWKGFINEIREYE